MWTYDNARAYMVAELRREADAQDQGRTGEVGAGFEKCDINLPRDGDSRFRALHIALNFWDGWTDARNHEWQYYEPIGKDDWPRLARAIASAIEANEDVTDSVVLQKFGIPKQRHRDGR